MRNRGALSPPLRTRGLWNPPPRTPWGSSQGPSWSEVPATKTPAASQPAPAGERLARRRAAHAPPSSACPPRPSRLGGACARISLPGHVVRPVPGAQVAGTPGRPRGRPLRGRALRGRGPPSRGRTGVRGRPRCSANLLCALAAVFGLAWGRPAGPEATALSAPRLRPCGLGGYTPAGPGATRDPSSVGPNVQGSQRRAGSSRRAWKAAQLQRSRLHARMTPARTECPPAPAGARGPRRSRPPRRDSLEGSAVSSAFGGNPVGGEAGGAGRVPGPLGPGVPCPCSHLQVGLGRVSPEPGNLLPADVFFLRNSPLPHDVV